MADDAQMAGRHRASGDGVDIVGANVSSEIADAAPSRPTVVVVTNAWGSNWGERAAATRLVAGAVALRARVVIVSIEDRSRWRHRQDRLRHDGLFPVYSAGAPTGRGTAGDVERPEDVAAAALQSDLIRTSLARQPGGVIPEAAARGLLARADQPSRDALSMTMAQQPDVVVLAGPATFWMADALPVGPRRPRVVVLPLSGNDPVLSSLAFRPLADQSDAIGVFSSLEMDRVTTLLPGASASKVRRMQIALPVNRLATTAGIVGVNAFGRYVLMISGFADDPASGRCPPHEYLRHVFGDIAVAEVRRQRWLVTGSGRSFEMTWTPTRMNLWRLMAQAAVTVDLRSPGPIGREAIESLHLGTPVVVPDSSVAAEHAAVANAGLWYRNQGEMVDFVRALLDDEVVRSQLGANGQQWAEQVHGDTERFVTQASNVVLGSPADAESFPSPAALPA